MVFIFLDKEIDIIEWIKFHLEDEIEFYPPNSLSKKIFRYLKNIDKFTENSGHNNLPPDFFSDEFSCMFDVMRINDSEVKKSYNPVKIRERNIEKELKQYGILDSIDSSNIFINSSSYKDEHILEYYQKNCNRVMSEHIKKIDIWVKEHPNIKLKGLVIFDETECYFEGGCFFLGGDKFLFIWDNSKPLIIHMPWMDKEFIDIAYQSKLDFIIWLCPYKSYSYLCREMNIYYPKIVILDVRWSYYDYKKYDKLKLTSM